MTNLHKHDFSINANANAADDEVLDGILMDTDHNDEQLPSSLLHLHKISFEAGDGVRPWSDVMILMQHLSRFKAREALMTGDDDDDVDENDGDAKVIPLHYAAVNAPRSVIDCMLAVAPDAARVKTPGGSLPLHYAASNNNVDAIKSLVEAYPEAVSERNSNGRTPFHWIARHASYSVIDFVLALAPDAVSVKDSSGWLPLHYAAKYNSVDVVKSLTRAYQGAFVETNDDGDSPINYLNLDELFELPLLEISYQALSNNRLLETG
mmetsp:Transcript_3665/g.4991  ORF Transcript_3665/g.4991 Transcript_3665/m.4991 type:complete len:265 (-) Transcript_3665:396-1190(-)